MRASRISVVAEWETVELFSLNLAGYRRFKNTAQLRTNGKVVALIGPNEAGKTSILDALISLNDAGAFEAGDFSRDTDSTETEVVAKFLLDEGEAVAAGLRSPSWMRIHKEHDGRLLFGFDPDAPDRDPTDRSAAIAAARALVRDAASLRAFEEAEDDLPDLLSATIDVLASSGPDLEADVMTKVRKVEAELAALDTELLGALPAYAALAPAWTRMIETEAAPSPFQQAVKTLRPLLPKFLLFDEAARRLASSYPMSDLASETPRALQALLNVAELNMADVMSAISRGAGDDLTTLEHKANRTLERAFREAWRQSGVSVELRLSTDLLEIRIRDEEERFSRVVHLNAGRTDPEDRDGVQAAPPPLRGRRQARPSPRPTDEEDVVALPPSLRPRTPGQMSSDITYLPCAISDRSCSHMSNWKADFDTASPSLGPTFSTRGIQEPPSSSRIALRIHFARSVGLWSLETV